MHGHERTRVRGDERIGRGRRYGIHHRHSEVVQRGFREGLRNGQEAGVVDGIVIRRVVVRIHSALRMKVVKPGEPWVECTGELIAPDAIYVHGGAEGGIGVTLTSLRHF